MKKNIVKFIAVFGLLVGFSPLVFASSNINYVDSTHATVTSDANYFEGLYQDGSSWSPYYPKKAGGQTLNVDSSTFPMIADGVTIRIYEGTQACVDANGFSTSTADPAFCGTLAGTILSNSGVFTGYHTTAPTVVQPVNFLETPQGATGTADLLLARVGNATTDTVGNLSPVVAVVGGVILAFIGVKFIVSLIKKTK